MELVVRLRDRMDRAQERVPAFAPRPRVAFLEWTDPLFVGGHWTPQLIERAGGEHTLNPTRAVAGAVVIDVAISPWLYVCTSFGAFFLACSKRWAEHRQLGPEAAAHRPSLAHYTGEILSQLVVISAATALLGYALYTIESDNVPRNGAMALTIPFVAFALFRYLLLLNGERRTDAPDQIIFTDPQILVSVAGFLVTAMTVMALHHY